jgi:hypothetical protein
MSSEIMSEFSTPTYFVRKKTSSDSSGNESVATDYTLETPISICESPGFSRVDFRSFGNVNQRENDERGSESIDSVIAKKKIKCVRFEDSLSPRKINSQKYYRSQSRIIAVGVPESIADDPVEQQPRISDGFPPSAAPSIVCQGPRRPDADGIAAHLDSCIGCFHQPADFQSWFQRDTADPYPIPTPRTYITVPPPSHSRFSFVPSSFYDPPPLVESEAHLRFLESRATGILEHHRRIRAAFDAEWFSEPDVILPSVEVKASWFKQARIQAAKYVQKCGVDQCQRWLAHAENGRSSEKRSAKAQNPFRYLGDALQAKTKNGYGMQPHMS